MAIVGFRYHTANVRRRISPPLVRPTPGSDRRMDGRRDAATADIGRPEQTPIAHSRQNV